jgi:AAA15 family ATPase/GTPase
MLKKISLSNFKSFKIMEDLELSDLTIIVGKNSCGKSSILQSLLLLKQTLESQSKVPLCMEGKYLKFSNLKEIAFGLPPMNTAQIGYKFNIELDGLAADLELNFKNKRVNGEYKVEVSKRQITNADTSLNAEKFFLLGLTKSRLSEALVEKFGGTEIFKNIKSFHVEYDGFAPEYISVELPLKSIGLDSRKYRVPVAMVAELEYKFGAALNKFLKNIKYLSHTRASPQRAYTHLALS